MAPNRHIFSVKSKGEKGITNNAQKCTENFCVLSGGEMTRHERRTCHVSLAKSKEAKHGGQALFLGVPAVFGEKDT